MLKNQNQKGEPAMIKGVTKSIIEINPRNACFEKIIVILNSSCEAPDKDEIRRQAELMTGAAPEYLNVSGGFTG